MRLLIQWAGLGRKKTTNQRTALLDHEVVCVIPVQTWSDTQINTTVAVSKWAEPPTGLSVRPVVLVHNVVLFIIDGLEVDIVWNIPQTGRDSPES